MSNEVERQRWNDARWARVWPKRERLTGMVTAGLLDAVGLGAGDQVLEVGCGAGAATLRAAEIVGAGGGVVGADISAPLIELASTRAAEAGVGNIAFRVVDMQTGDPGGGPFTVAMSQFGVMFFDEPPAAFANIRAQLVPGGRLGFACWQAAERNPWFFASALAGFLAPPPQPAPGKSPTGPFALADHERTRGILRDAGFVDIDIAEHQAAVEAPQDAVVDDEQLLFMGVAAERMAAAREAVDRHLAPFRQPSGASVFPLAYLVVTARSPQA